MHFNIDWQKPKEVRNLIKTLELTHPYQTVTDNEGEKHMDNVKYLEAQLPNETPITITLFKTPTIENPEKMIVETQSHAVVFNQHGHELNIDVQLASHQEKLNPNFEGDQHE